MSPPELEKVFVDNTDLPEGLIKRFAMHNPSDVAGAIDRWRGEVAREVEANPDLPEGLIKRFARANPSDVAGAIRFWRAGKGPATPYDYLRTESAGAVIA